MAMTEVNFRKMSKANRLKWSRVKCKIDLNTISQSPRKNSQKKNFVANNFTADYNLKDPTDSVNFMSNKFDNLGE
jgi:hypothetical protein